jgi:hypothetical protein
MSATQQIVETDIADLDPVELDPPSPEVVRWQELADRNIRICHEGDAEKVIPFPRPAGADPDCDIVGKGLAWSYYTSEWADVTVAHSPGAVDDDHVLPASVRVRAKWCGDGGRFVGLSMRDTQDGKWEWPEGFGLTSAEALELADVLRAAVDLLGGAK